MAIAAAASTAKVPIVFSVGFDPVGNGLIESLSHPGRNVTSFSGGGLELGPEDPVSAQRSPAVDAAFQAFAKAGVGGVMNFSGTPSTFDVRDRLAALALQYRLPMVVQSGQAHAGGLLSYGANVPDLFRRTAELVNWILRGASPAHIPVEQPNVFDFVVNLRTARALGVVSLPRVLLRATNVIE